MAARAVRSMKAWSLSDRLISRNSRSARSVSGSSTVRSCRHCSGRRKSRAGRNSASRRHTRNNEEPGQYTRGAVRGSPNAVSHLSGRKAAGCCSAADGSPAGSRSHASVAPAVYERAWPPRRPAAATERRQLIEIRGATSPHHRQSTAGGPLKSVCKPLRSLMQIRQLRGMSASGRSRQSGDVQPTSDLPRGRDINRPLRLVRFMPTMDSKEISQPDGSAKPHFSKLLTAMLPSSIRIICPLVPSCVT